MKLLKVLKYFLNKIQANNFNPKLTVGIFLNFFFLRLKILLKLFKVQSLQVFSII